MNRGKERAVFVRMPRASAATALLGSGSTTALLISGSVPGDSPSVWPLVVLALGSMANDLGIRALRRTAK